MNKKIIAMSIFVIFVITVIQVASDAPKLTNRLTAPPGDFDHFFKGFMILNSPADIFDLVRFQGVILEDLTRKFSTQFGMIFLFTFAVVQQSGALNDAHPAL